MFTVARHFGDAVCNEIHHINAGNALLLEQEYRLAFLLAENGHEHVGAGHFTLARTLDVKYRTLQDPLKTERRLGFTVFIVNGDQRGCGINKLLQVMLEFVEVCAAGA